MANDQSPSTNKSSSSERVDLSPASAPTADPHLAAAAQRARAEVLARELRQPAAGTAHDARWVEANALLKPLRAQRAFAQMLDLCEPLLRLRPDVPQSRLAYAQALIETGSVVPALAIAADVAGRLPPSDPLWTEAWGNVGRCHKQIFVDATRDLMGEPAAAAQAALHLAVAAYAKPYDADPAKNYWHGVNLLALASRAAKEGWDLQPPVGDLTDLASRLRQVLQSRKAQGDRWALASLVEVALGQAMLTGKPQGVEDLLADYLFAPGVEAFEVASTLRQFTEVWDLDTLTPRTRGSRLRTKAQVAWAQRLLDIMRTRLLQLPGGVLQLSPTQLAAAAQRAPAAANAAAKAAAKTAAVAAAARSPSKTRRSGRAPLALEAAAADGEGSVAMAGAVGAAADGAIIETGPEAPPAGRLEALLSDAKAKPFTWWLGGVQAARAVAVVRRRMGKRVGSGFLVRASDFGDTTTPGELLLLTNFHVVNREGMLPGIEPDAAEVVFEALEDKAPIDVTGLIWQSPILEHDAALLRLARVPAGVEPVRLARKLPKLPAADVEEVNRPRVYVIGHPGGGDLSISLTDNALIDHEGPPTGNPPKPAVWRVHYRAPTEQGSSGSPVFEENEWAAIALHHMGRTEKMKKLNGAPGDYPANEGLALLAIAQAAKTELTR